MESIRKYGRLIIPCLMLCWSTTAAFSNASDGSKDSCPRTYNTVQEMLDATLTKESENEWQKINWQSNAALALKQAQQEHKPIFILFLVNEKKYLAKKSGQT
jgi:hypothetical protein